MTEVTQDDLESVEAENDRKREVLASLKAHETALVTSNVFDDRRNALLAEGELLDQQIDNQLDVLAGHAGLPSTDIEDAKRQMLAAVSKQVAEVSDATEKANKEAKTAVDADAKARAAQATENAAQEEVENQTPTTSRLEKLLSVGTQPAPVVEPPTPAEVVTPIPPVEVSGTGVSADSSAPSGELPAPPLPDASALQNAGSADNAAKDGE